MSPSLKEYNLALSNGYLYCFLLFTFLNRINLLQQVCITFFVTKESLFGTLHGLPLLFFIFYIFLNSINLLQTGTHYFFL